MIVCVCVCVCVCVQVGPADVLHSSVPISPSESANLHIQPGPVPVGLQRPHSLHGGPRYYIYCNQHSDIRNDKLLSLSLSVCV